MGCRLLAGLVIVCHMCFHIFARLVKKGMIMPSHEIFSVILASINMIGLPTRLMTNGQ